MKARKRPKTKSPSPFPKIRLLINSDGHKRAMPTYANGPKNTPPLIIIKMHNASMTKANSTETQIFWNVVT